MRLEAVRALAAIGGRRAAELALHAVDHERDEPLDYAVWLTARDLRDAWLPAVLDGTFGDDGRFGRVLYAVRAADASDAIPRIVARVEQGGLSAEDRATALACIAALGNPQQMRLVYDMVVNPATPAADRLPLLSSLMEAYARRRIVPAASASMSARGIFTSLPVASRSTSSVSLRETWMPVTTCPSSVCTTSVLKPSLTFFDGWTSESIR